LDCVKDELEKMIQNFKADKKFNMYAFGSVVTPWKQCLQTSSPQNKLDALQWVKQLSAKGSTALYQALEKVVECDPSVRNIYVLSDGHPDDKDLVLSWIDKHPKIIINATCFLGGTSLQEFMATIARKSSGVSRVLSEEMLRKKGL